MRCIECENQAVALCAECMVGQCAEHLRRSREARARTGALGGCHHRELSPVLGREEDVEKTLSTSSPPRTGGRIAGR